jgi:hypothetical protein
VTTGKTKYFFNNETVYLFSEVSCRENILIKLAAEEDSCFTLLEQKLVVK